MLPLSMRLVRPTYLVEAAPRTKSVGEWKERALLQKIGRLSDLVSKSEDPQNA
jgi:hypothetical protein